LKLSIIILISIFTCQVNAQSNTINTEKATSKIFKKSKLNIIQSKYLDNNGSASYQVFLKKKGLYPIDKKHNSKPYFKVSLLKSDLIKNEKVQIKNSTSLLNLDFYIENNVSYYSLNQTLPVFDGRIYLDNDQIIVGGYSSNHNERPIGLIDVEGDFILNLNDLDAEDFPLLKIPTKELLFDPFHIKLLQLKSNKKASLLKSNHKYLPLDIYNKKGKLLSNTQYELVYQKENGLLFLNGFIDGEKIEIAQCDIHKSEVVQNEDAYRPELIPGASQLGNQEIVSLTFKGNFSTGIASVENELFLNNVSTNAESLQRTSSITMDGDFSDWRNIKGVQDQKSDYVSYLYNNPDTDLLEFKVTNDDKYIYFYTRVAGAHGRTGKTGRYYWYTYIDVDQDHKTGYPPTRDDNCYFGIAIGDDSEAQFEFVGNKFVKTFFGFTGTGTEEDVLNGKLKIGASFYASKDAKGNQRDRYKMEYVNRNGSRFITEDYTAGTSNDIIIALSPDGSEVEVRVELAGFLKDAKGRSLMHVGKKIDIAVGVEGSSDYYNSKDWGADSSPVIYGYQIN